MTKIASMVFMSAVISLFPVFPSTPSAQQLYDGTFSVIWGDDFSSRQSSPQRYFLSTTEGDYELLLSKETIGDAGGLLALNGRSITVSANYTGPSRTNGVTTRLTVDTIVVHRTTLRDDLLDQSALGSQPWVSIMCKFNNVTDEPKDLDYFINMYASSAPGLNHYWQEASYDKVNVSGSSAVGWFTLPQPRSYYIYDMNSDDKPDLDFNRITTDCTNAADASIYFPSFVGINMMFNDDLDGYAWGGSQYINIDGQTRRYRVTWEPPWGYEDITVIAHEMGHGFGMPHSSGNYGQTYDNVWDVMSNSWAYCRSANHPTYGCLGQHTIAYHRGLVGWIDPQQQFTYAGSEQVTLTLQSLTQPVASGYLMAKIPIDGSTSHYYTVEWRRKTGYDTKLPAEAVIIHEVDTSRQRPAYVIDIDNNGDTGDDGAIWLQGETYSDMENKICISVKEKSSTTVAIAIGCTESPPSTPPAPPLGTAILAPLYHLLLQ